MRNTRLNQLGAVLLAILLVSSSSVALVGTVASSSAPGSELDRYGDPISDMSTWTGWDPSDDVLRYGAQGHTGWVVTYDEHNNGSAELLEWVNDSRDRKVLQHNDDGNWILLTAPADEIGVSWYYRNVERHYPDLIAEPKLSDQDFVLSVTPNMRIESTDPVTTLANSSSFSSPNYGDWSTLGGNYGEFTADGVAWDSDADLTTMHAAADHTDSLETGYTGSGINVSVIDSGLNYDEQLYQDRVIAGKNTLTNETAAVVHDDDGSVNVSQSDYSVLANTNLHGDFVTAQIAANGSSADHRGIAPDSNIISVRALDDDGSGSTASVAAAISYSCTNGADVVSMSLGGPLPQDLITEQMRSCVEEHDVSAFVIAAGNERQTLRWLSYPANEPDLPVISVAASNGAPPEEGQIAYFSNVGPHPQTDMSPTVSAPGMAIETQLNDGTGITTQELSGTSMATPIVSGAIAQLLEAEPTLAGDPHEVRHRLVTTAAPIPQAGTTETGAGMVNTQQLIDEHTPDERQADVRDSTAESRDTANNSLSGSFLRSLLEEGIW